MFALCCADDIVSDGAAPAAHTTMAAFAVWGTIYRAPTIVCTALAMTDATPSTHCIALLPFDIKSQEYAVELHFREQSNQSQEWLKVTMTCVSSGEVITLGQQRSHR